MQEDLNSAMELRKKLLINQIDALLILARQRGLPIEGFSRSELEKQTLVDLREVHDGLKELVYAPPARS